VDGSLDVVLWMWSADSDRVFAVEEQGAGPGEQVDAQGVLEPGGVERLLQVALAVTDARPVTIMGGG
jgi:hypothetical protein